MIPVPPRMQHLDRDRRGIPIPWGVFRDSDGDPHFTINDESKRHRMMAEGLCSICGAKLPRGHWFVGGPLSAYHPDGCYIDPPMHKECMVYALRVCPYLAAPRYERRIDDRTLKAKGGRTLLMLDPTMIPERPALFVGVLSAGVSMWRAGMQTYLRPKLPYISVEYWQRGSRLPQADGEALVEAALRAGPHGPPKSPPTGAKQTRKPL